MGKGGQLLHKAYNIENAGMEAAIWPSSYRSKIRTIN